MGRPKALLPLGDETFLSRVVRSLEAGGIDEIVIVTGLHDAEIRDAWVGAPFAAGIRLVHNPDHDLGQLSSLLAGLDALGPHPPDGILVALVDQPAVRAVTVTAIVQAWHDRNAPIVRPVYQGRHGHPVLFAAETFEALRAAPLEEGARAVVRAFGARVEDVTVDDPGICLDVDTPEDYERLLRQARVQRGDAGP
jgi:molybdenum cofactor cytidylyltransferase